MEEPQDINSRLDELFAKARTGKPVMGVDEVRNLIATAPVTASPGTDKPGKSNYTLYMLLGVIAITAGIWFYLESDNQPAAVTQNTSAVTAVENNSSATDVTANTNNDAAQANETGNDVVNNQTADNENKQGNEDVASKATEKVEVKAKPASTDDKGKPAETNAEPSKKTTYLVTGGDFVVNFQTDDKVVKMKLREDAVKELNINGKVVADAEYPKYKDIIDQGKKMMADEKSKNPSNASSAKTAEELKRDEANKLLFTAFTEQLKKDKLINEDKYSFKLTSGELLIDGKPQPETVRQKYVELFKSTSGRDIGGATFKFDHGMN